MGKPKHISGISVRGTGGFDLQILFVYSEEYGYDKIVKVLDMDQYDSLDSPLVAYDNNTVIMAYRSAPDKFMKKIRVSFSSGDFEDINVILPPKDRGLKNHPIIDLVEAYVGGMAEISSTRFSFEEAFSKNYPKATVASIPHSDPKNVFGYPKSWTTGSSDSLLNFSSEEISSMWAKNGYIGGRPSPETASIQYVSFPHILGVDGLSDPASVTSNILSKTGEPLFILFTWAKDLKKLGSNGVRREFDVCNDACSPSYYRTTKEDVLGNDIPEGYLSGSLPAVWKSSACSHPCEDFKIRVFPVKSSKTTNSVTVFVIGNNDTPHYTNKELSSAEELYDKPSYPALSSSSFVFKLILPGGVSYSEALEIPSAGSTSYKWENVPVSENPYTIQVLDVTTGATREIPFTTYNEASQSETRNCACGESGSLNFSGVVAGDPDPCGICLSCKQGFLEKAGVNTGQNLILNTNSQVISPSVFGANDGGYVFNGSVNTSIDPALEGFLSGTFHMDLFKVPDGGTAPLPIHLIDQPAGLTSPSYVFNGLTEGYYVLHVYSTGQACVSSYKFRLLDPAEKDFEVCVPGITFGVNPCTGQTTFLINSDQEIAVTYLLNGTVVPGNMPPFVQANDVVGVHVNYAGNECVDYYTEYTINQSDLFCPQNNPPIIFYGCTDPAAANYSAFSTTDDGSCIYGVMGCMDPEASNYSSLATIENGTCTYGIPGCTNPGSANYDPNAIIDDGSCFDPCQELIILSVADNSNVPAINFIGTPPVPYSVTWTNTSTGEVTTTNNSSTGPLLEDGVYIIEITSSNGCSQTYVYGLNTPVVFGCMDINGSNFSPAANAPGWMADLHGSSGIILSTVCTYQLEPSVCVPIELERRLNDINSCMSDLSSKYLSLLKAGMVKNCNDKNVRILKLIQYVISRRGLDCIYNCADSLSPTYSETDQGTTCETRWSTGGTNGPNLVYDPSLDENYVWGDVVQHPETGTIFVYTGTDPLVGSVDPMSISNQVWTICREPEPIIDHVNRLDAYLSFVRDACRDCQLPAVPPVHPDQSQQSVGDGPGSMNGDTMEFDDEEANF